MTRRERSLSKSMRRLSRPLSLMLSEFTAKKTSELISGSLGGSSMEQLDSLVLQHTQLEKALQLDFEASSPTEFGFEEPMSPSDASDASDLSASDLSTTDLSTTDLMSGSRAARTSSWHVERNKGIFIYQDDACISNREAYNPWRAQA